MVMSLDRKTKIQAIRQRLANLTATEREAIAQRGLVATVEGRTLSLHNTILVTIQANGYTPTVVGGFNQWKLAGRIVKRGEHGLMIWFPVGRKNDDDTIIEADTFYTGTVFDISQTELIGATKQEAPTPTTAIIPIMPKPESKPEPKPIESTSKVDDIMTGWRII